MKNSQLTSSLILKDWILSPKDEEKYKGVHSCHFYLWLSWRFQLGHLGRKHTYTFTSWESLPAGDPLPVTYGIVVPLKCLGIKANDSHCDRWDPRSLLPMRLYEHRAPFLWGAQKWNLSAIPFCLWLFWLWTRDVWSVETGVWDLTAWLPSLGNP